MVGCLARIGDTDPLANPPTDCFGSVSCPAAKSTRRDAREEQPVIETTSRRTCRRDQHSSHSMSIATISGSLEKRECVLKFLLEFFHASGGVFVHDASNMSNIEWDIADFL